MKFLWITLGVLVVAVAIVQWRAAVREAEANRNYPPDGQMLDVGGVPVHARVVGSGPDLVLLHGASGNTREIAFGPVDALAKDFRVVIFDRPGLGHTGHVRPEYASVWHRAAESPFEQAALLQAAAAQLGVENPIVVGHSFGGAVAWAWGLSAPDDTAALVSLAGVANPWPGTLSLQHRVNSTVAGAALIVPLITAFVPDSVIQTVVRTIFEPQVAPEGYEEAAGVSLILRRHSMRANARQITSLRPHIVEMSARYGELTMPVEILHGEADTIVPAFVHSTKLPDQIPGANLTLLEGAGHMITHTHKRDVLAAIERAAMRAGLR